MDNLYVERMALQYCINFLRAKPNLFERDLDPDEIFREIYDHCDNAAKEQLADRVLAVSALKEACAERLYRIFRRRNDRCFVCHDSFL